MIEPDKDCPETKEEESIDAKKEGEKMNLKSRSYMEVIRGNGMILIKYHLLIILAILFAVSLSFAEIKDACQGPDRMKNKMKVVFAETNYELIETMQYHGKHLFLAVYGALKENGGGMEITIHPGYFLKTGKNHIQVSRAFTNTRRVSGRDNYYTRISYTFGGQKYKVLPVNISATAIIRETSDNESYDISVDRAQLIKSKLFVQGALCYRINTEIDNTIIPTLRVWLSKAKKTWVEVNYDISGRTASLDVCSHWRLKR